MFYIILTNSWYINYQYNLLQIINITLFWFPFKLQPLIRSHHTHLKAE